MDGQGGLPSSEDLSADSYLQSDSDYLEISTPSNGSSYTNDGPVDHIRRDGNLSHPVYHQPQRRHPTHFGPHGGVIAEGSSFRPCPTFSSDSTPGSGSSPSTGARALSYDPYQTSTAYTGYQHHPGATASLTTIGPPFIQRFPTLPEAHHHMPPPLAGIPGYTTPTVDGLPHNVDDHLPHHHATVYYRQPHPPPAGYTEYLEVGSRSALSYANEPRLRSQHQPPLGIPSSMPPPMRSTSMSSHNHSGNSEPTGGAAMPWPEQRGIDHLDYSTPDGTIRGEVGLAVEGKIDKGFFEAQEDGKWTCYRRNYFNVTGQIWLVLPHEQASFPPGVQLYYTYEGQRHLVQAIGVKLRAIVDGDQGKEIPIIQFTAKRDAGPKTSVMIMKIMPQVAVQRLSNGFHPTQLAMPMNTGQPHLPLQHLIDPTPEGAVTAAIAPDARAPQQPLTGHPGVGQYGSQARPGFSTSHTFERLQFKSATQNNGKRRASQQFYLLEVQMYVDVRKNGEEAPDWRKIVTKVSDKIVVRGRSPSHYSNEGVNNNGARGGGNNRRISNHHTQAGPNSHPGSFRPSNGYSGLRPSEPDGFSGGPGGYPGGFPGGPGGYPGGPGDYPGGPGHQHYHISDVRNALEHSPPFSQGSAEGGASDEEHDMEPEDGPGYTYYPHGAMVHVVDPTAPNVQLPALPKIESAPRSSTDPRQYATDPRQYATPREFPSHVLRGSTATEREYPGARLPPSWSTINPDHIEGYDTSTGYFPDISDAYQ